MTLNRSQVHIHISASTVWYSPTVQKLVLNANKETGYVAAPCYLLCLRTFTLGQPQLRQI